MAARASDSDALSRQNMVENADIPRPCEANQEENEWSRDINISCGSTRAFAQGKVGIYPRGVCVLCVTDIPTVKLPMGNHYGYIKKNKRTTHDIPRTK